MKKGIDFLSVLLVLVLGGILVVLLSASDSNEDEAGNWAYAIENVICIGDSLTSGSYFGGDEPGSIKQSYPWYLSRMLDTDVTNAGVEGYSASDWHENELAKYDFSKYSVAIIWLGTNNGMEPNIEKDVLPFENREDYLKTELGYYCSIIDHIKKQNSDIEIILMKIFASKDDVDQTNKAIEQVAEYYGLHTIETANINMDNPQLHLGIENPHFGKAGNIAVANLIVSELDCWYGSQPMRCEFGVEYIE